MFNRRQFLKLIAALPFLNINRPTQYVEWNTIVDDVGGYLVPHEYSEKLQTRAFVKIKMCEEIRKDCMVAQPMIERVLKRGLRDR